MGECCRSRRIEVLVQPAMNWDDVAGSILNSIEIVDAIIEVGRAGNADYLPPLSGQNFLLSQRRFLHLPQCVHISNKERIPEILGELGALTGQNIKGQEE